MKIKWGLTEAGVDFVKWGFAPPRKPYDMFNK